MARAAGTDGRTCPACGAPLPSSTSGAARWCARCGTAVDGPLTVVDLGAPASDAITERIVVDSRPPYRFRWPVAVALLAVVGLIVWMLGRDGDDPAAAPVATDPPATSETPSTTEAPPTSAATTAAPPATTTTIPYVDQRMGRVLDAAQDGRSLWFVDQGVLVRVELGTGRVTRTQLDRVDQVVVGVLGDRVILHEQVTDQLVFYGFDGRPIDRFDLATFLPVVVRSNGMWLSRWSDGTVPGQVRRVRADGAVDVDVQLPAGTLLAAVSRDHAWVTGYGRIWSVNATGRFTPYSVGTLVAVTEEHVLWIGCDEPGRCAWHLGTTTDPDSGRVALDVSLMQQADATPWSTTMSPDASTVIARVTQRSQVEQFVALATGDVLGARRSQSGRLVWTPDGQWAIELEGIRNVVATNVWTGEVAIRSYDFARNVMVQIAIG